MYIERDCHNIFLGHFFFNTDRYRHRWALILDFILPVSDMLYCAFHSDSGSLRYQTELLSWISDDIQYSE
jgi:hypothetical protein